EEKAGLARTREQFGENARGPSHGTPPIIFSEAFAAILRQGDARPAVEHRFANRGDGSRIVHIGAEIRALIDAAQHPLRVGHHAEQPESRAIGWRPVYHKTNRGPFFEPDGA